MSDGPIGFVGVGNMGAAMAERALARGADVVVYDIAANAVDRLRLAGARVAESPAAVARKCAQVSVAVNYDHQVIDAVAGSEGILSGAQPKCIVAIHSTIHQGTLSEVVAAAATRSVVVVDAAVTGGVDAARRGELAVMVGADTHTFEALRPALELYASRVVRVGECGAGLAAKLALMVISFGKLAAAHEGIKLAHACGVDLDEFVAIVRHSEEQSGIHEFFLRERAALYDPRSTRTLQSIGAHESPKSQKDLHAALALAQKAGIELPVTAVAHDAMPATWGVG